MAKASGTFDKVVFSGHFLLKDDVDNVIRGVSYGFGNTLVGALTGTEDISLGQQSTHILVFSVPPKKTKHLILLVKLESFGGEGIAKFKIPVEQIRGFVP